MTDEHDAPVDEPTESQLADLVRAAAGVAAPEGVRAVVASADRPEAGPRPGELWRARGPGAGAIALVWLRSLTPAGAVAVPVSFDTEPADDDTLILPGDASPLGLPLALHEAVETTVDRHSLVDRLGSIDPAAVEAARTAQARALAGTPAPLEDRIEASGAGEADQAWWPLDTLTDGADLLKAIHQVLADSHPGARIAPRPAASAGSEHLSAVALVAELDAFVLVAAIDHPVDAGARLEVARQVLHADQLLNAVCLVEPGAPFLSVVIDRRDVVAAIETPSGELRPPRQSRSPAPVGIALSKFLDATISPFGRLARTFVEGRALDPRALAVDVSADAVRTVEGSAKGFKTEGKRPGYERVKRHKTAITRLVEEALNQPGVDVAAILDEDDP
ncbi:MAG TPA: hypothetical protein VFF24_14170 [Acidimicrobiia bacterium]|nr:hypothetical protein [Acidimicrobiia bacterium]